MTHLIALIFKKSSEALSSQARSQSAGSSQNATAWAGFRPRSLTAALAKCQWDTGGPALMMDTLMVDVVLHYILGLFSLKHLQASLQLPRLPLA